MKKKMHKLLALGLLGFLASPISAQTINGRLETADGYGAAKCLQNNYTQFGDAINGSVIEAIGGSELDGGYGKIANGKLYLMFTGNLESNYNKLEIFLDYKAGGQNVLTATNPLVSSYEDVNKMEGLKFDAGFESDFWLDVTNGKSGTGQPVKVALYVAETNGDPVNGFVDNPLPDVTTTVAGGPYNMTMTGGQLGIDNSNIAGVGGAIGQINNPSAVTTGVEMVLPLSYLPGYTSGPIKVCAFINGSGHDYVSNQVLCGLGTAGEMNNLQNPKVGTANYLNGVDFSVIAGDQYFVIGDNSAIEGEFSIGYLAVSPTPANEILNIYLNTTKKLAANSTFEVLDMQGKVQATHSFSTELGNNEFRINLENLASGVYILRAQNGEYTTQTKFVKN